MVCFGHRMIIDEVNRIMSNEEPHFEKSFLLFEHLQLLIRSLKKKTNRTSGSGWFYLTEDQPDPFMVFSCRHMIIDEVNRMMSTTISKFIFSF